MKPGDDVVYIGCTCEPRCENAELCGIKTFGTMEFRSVQAFGGRLVCRLDTGEFEVFEPHEVELVDVVAKRAMAGVAER